MREVGGRRACLSSNLVPCRATAALASARHKDGFASLPNQRGVGRRLQMRAQLPCTIKLNQPSRLRTSSAMTIALSNTFSAPSPLTRQISWCWYWCYVRKLKGLLLLGRWAVGSIVNCQSSSVVSRQSSVNCY